MVIFGKTVVAAGGTPGPLLGDGTKTTATLIFPTAVTQAPDANSSSTRTSIVNQTTRIDFKAAKLKVWSKRGNTNPTFVGGRGATNADMAQLGSPAAGATGFSPTLDFGSGYLEDINIADFDVDATTNGEAIEWMIECR